MKKILLTLLIPVSQTVLGATDFEKYCLPLLNSSPNETLKMMEGFEAKKDKIIINEKTVESVSILPKELDRVGEKKTVLKPWGEEIHMEILKFKKNGKAVRDFTLIISRDKEGRLLSLTKKPVLLQDLKIKPDTLTFRVVNNTCIPDAYVEGTKLKFSTDLCRGLDTFYRENPSAKACMDAKFDQKLAALIKEHAVGLGEKIVTGIEKKLGEYSPLYGAKHRVDCTEYGLDELLLDKSLWDEPLKFQDKKIQSNTEE
jgi:hypothetical protein